MQSPPNIGTTQDTQCQFAMPSNSQWNPAISAKLMHKPHWPLVWVSDEHSLPAPTPHQKCQAVLDAFNAAFKEGRYWYFSP